MDQVSIPNSTQESIEEKALRLYRAGRVTRLHGDVWQVSGDTGIYTVNLYSGGCDCPARGRCSHELGAEIGRAKLNARTARKLKAARARKREPGFSREQILQNIASFGGAA